MTLPLSPTLGQAVLLSLTPAMLGLYLELCSEHEYINDARRGAVAFLTEVPLRASRDDLRKSMGDEDRPCRLEGGVNRG